MTEAISPRREVNPENVRSLLGFVESAFGGDALTRFLRTLPGDPSVSELIRPDRWWSEAEFAELVDRVEAFTGVSHIGRLVGLNSYLAVLNSPDVEVLRSLGSLPAAAEAMAARAARMSTSRRYELVRAEPNLLEIAGTYGNDVVYRSYSCDAMSGFFGALPDLFGQVAVAVEVECHGRGDARCLFRVSYWPRPDGVTPSERRTSLVRGLSSLEQLEIHHAAAADLVRATQVNDVLERIVTQVSAAMSAPTFVLAVRLPGEEQPRVHRAGSDTVDTVDLVRVLDGAEAPPPNAAVVPIVVDGAPIGQLGALMPVGTTATDHDRRALRSFAQYAGAALEIVLALEDAHEARDTATALLTLARSLSRIERDDDVAGRVATALPAALACDVAVLWHHEPDAGRLSLAAALDATGRPVTTGVGALSTDDELVRSILDGQSAVHVARDDVDGWAAELMDALAVSAALVVPIVGRDGVMALVSGGFAEPPAPELLAVLLERLQGMADQAAIAFENARLIDAMRHQALHDDLTGLAQRALAEDCCTHALARRARTGETVALLFVDLDGFKDVNDSAGHAVGDRLLQEVAGRVADQARGSDTCARLGGDEFILVLNGLESAAGATDVAQRILGLFTRPFEIDGREMSITASIGVAVAADEPTTFEELLQRSDAAMYGAKRAGKNAYAVG